MMIGTENTTSLPTLPKTIQKSYILLLLNLARLFTFFINLSTDELFILLKVHSFNNQTGSWIMPLYKIQ